MKRVLVVAVALALIFSSNPAGAELLKNFHLSGQIDVQATSANNVLDFATRQNSAVLTNGGKLVGVACGGVGQPTCATTNNDRIGTAQTRLMLHMDWDLLDDVHSHVTLSKNDRDYGTAGGGNPHGSVTNVQTLTTPGGTDVLGNVFVDEAYFKVDKVAGQVDTTLGRQFYGDAGDIVIYYGPSDKAWYGMPVSAIDAARFDWKSEWLAATGLVAKQKGAAVGGVAAADVDVRGLNLLFKGNDNFHASFYGWNKVTHATGALGTPPAGAGGAGGGGKNDNLYLIGLKAKIQGGGFWLKGEFDQNVGDNRLIAGVTDDANFAVARHYEGWATMLNGGYKVEDDNVGMFGFWGEYTVGSGASSTKESKNDGFVSINGDYRPGSIYGRFAADPGGAGGAAGLGSGLYNSVNVGDSAAANSFVSSSNLNNRVIWGTGIKMSPAVANKLTLAFSWWDYRMQRFANIPNAPAPYQGNRHIGSEFDIDAIWAHSENVAFATGWGTFQPGGLIQEAAQNSGGGASAPASAGSGQPVDPIMLAYFDVRVKF